MDNVNIESTLNFIEKYDKKLIEEMDNITFEYNGLSKEGNKLLQILNYSPKVIKPTRDKIKNLKGVEIPQFSELKNLDYSKLNVNTIKKSGNNEIKAMIKNLLISIIDEIINNINNNKENKKSDINEIKQFNIINNDIIKFDNNIINKYSHDENILNEIFVEIKVFLFNQDDFIIISIRPEDSIKVIKEKIINKIIAEKDYEIKYNNEDDYDLRIMNEEGDKYKIGKSIKDTKLIFEKNIKIISFMENKLYKIKSSKL